MTVGRLREILNTINNDVEITVCFNDYDERIAQKRDLFIKRAEVIYTDTEFVSNEVVALVVEECNR